MCHEDNAGWRLRMTTRRTDRLLMADELFDLPDGGLDIV